MSIDVKITSGNREAIVSDEGSLSMHQQGLPPVNPIGRGQVFRQFLTDDGTASGSNDMQVDGSTTAVPFWVQADNTYDLYLSSLSFVIADQNATLNAFGAITALTNGCELEYFTDGGVTTIASALKSNFDFVRLCLGQPSFGDGAGAFRANNVSGNSEGYIPVLDLKTVFGLQWGVRLRPGTTDKLTLRVNDDTTGVDAFNCITYGFTRR